MKTTDKKVQELMLANRNLLDIMSLTEIVTWAFMQGEISALNEQLRESRPIMLQEQAE